MSKKVGIIGYGWVGKAMNDLFPDALVYDPYINVMDAVTVNYVTENDKHKISACDVVFIGVPTPNAEKFDGSREGELDCSIVEESIAWCNADLIVIRSTVNPGFTDRMYKKYGKNIVVQPEYLGETPAHPMLDMSKRQFMIIGGKQEDRKNLIDLYTTVYNANVSIKQVSAKEAEIIKMTENRAIAYKVAQCQELYDVCEKAGVDYYMIRDAVYGDDPRFNLWFTFVYPDNRGMNSKCIPKDVYAWCAWAESLGYNPEITRALLAKNKQWLEK